MTLWAALRLPTMARAVRGTMAAPAAVVRGAVPNVWASGLHTSSLLAAAPRPAEPRYKAKTHSAAKKRFFPVQGSTKGSPVMTKFKRASANKQHLNSGMSRVRLHRLGGAKIVTRGAVNKMLRRLLGPLL
jgi:hypothetical protein